MVMDRIIKQIGPVKIEWSLNNPMNSRYRVLEGGDILNKKVRREAFNEAYMFLVGIPIAVFLFCLSIDMWARIFLFVFIAISFAIFGWMYVMARNQRKNNLIIDMFHADRNKLDFLRLGEFQVDSKVNDR